MSSSSQFGRSRLLRVNCLYRSSTATLFLFVAVTWTCVHAQSCAGDGSRCEGESGRPQFNYMACCNPNMQCIPDPGAAQDPDNKWGKFCLQEGSTSDNGGNDVALGGGTTGSTSPTQAVPSPSDGANSSNQTTSSPNNDKNKASVEESSKGSRKVSGGLIAGALVGVAVVVAIAACGILALLRQRREQSSFGHNDSNQDIGMPSTSISPNRRKSVDLEHGHPMGTFPRSSPMMQVDDEPEYVKLHNASDLNEGQRGNWSITSALRDASRLMMRRERENEVHPPPQASNERDSENVPSWFSKS